MKDKSLAFSLGLFCDLDDVSVSNRCASIGGQNQQEHEGPNEPFSQIRNPRHHLPPEYPQASSRSRLIAKTRLGSFNNMSLRARQRSNAAGVALEAITAELLDLHVFSPKVTASGSRSICSGVAPTCRSINSVIDNATLPSPENTVSAPACRKAEASRR
jgi:hypothetical protein